MRPLIYGEATRERSFFLKQSKLPMIYLLLYEIFTPSLVVFDEFSLVINCHGRKVFVPSPSSLHRTRVLVLDPDANYHSALRCALVEISMKTMDHAKNSYKALSYVWGSRMATQPLLCEGQHIFITQNCESALRYLRHATKSITLWVDAICINQENDVEKSSQIMLMRDIYQSAEETLV
jgi:hypothetical protein